MSTPTQALDLGALPPPERNRRARRRRGWALLLFAVASLVLAVLCVVWLFSDEVANAPEGMLALSLMLMGLMLVAAAVGFVAWGLTTLVRRHVIRQPGWLRDPVDASQIRWWDGQRWTEHTSPRRSDVVPLTAPARSPWHRRRLGLLLLVGGVAVVVGAQTFLTFVVDPTADGGIATSVGLLAAPLPLPALGAALVGVYLLLTVDDVPPPSWQADPLDDSRLRWWDGDSWSDATAETPSA